MFILISNNADKTLCKMAQNPNQGYGYRSHYDESGEIYHERQVGDGTSPWSRINNDYRERVMDYHKVMDEGMKDEWGEDKGAKPMGTNVVKKKKKKRSKNTKREDSDLGYITEYERINRTNPKFIGRVQKHFRRKNDPSPGRTPVNNRGAWPHNREIWPKLPREEPETWEERTNRDMFL